MALEVDLPWTMDVRTNRKGPADVRKSDLVGHRRSPRLRHITPEGGAGHAPISRGGDRPIVSCGAAQPLDQRSTYCQRLYPRVLLRMYSGMD